MEKTSMTQRELDAKMRELTAKKTTALNAISEQEALYIDNIDKTRQLINSFHTTIALDKERLKQCHVDRYEIIRTYQHDRLALLNTADVLPGENPRGPVSRVQCFKIQRMLVKALHVELERHGYEDVEEATVSFDMKDDGSLSWSVYIPELNNK